MAPIGQGLDIGHQDIGGEGYRLFLHVPPVTRDKLPLPKRLLIISTVTSCRPVERSPVEEYKAEATSVIILAPSRRARVA